MASSRARTKHLAAVAIEQYVRKHRTVIQMTLTHGGELRSKEVCDRMFKPVKDWLEHRNIPFVGMWQLQKRGAWHIHFLVDRYIDIKEFRPFVMARGWGPMVNTTPKKLTLPDGMVVYYSKHGAYGIVDYLVKELTRAVWDPRATGKKLFVCDTSSRVGTLTCKAPVDPNTPDTPNIPNTPNTVKRVCTFKWRKEVHAASYLYAMGRDYFVRTWGFLPAFKDMLEVIRQGVRATCWDRLHPDWLEELGFG